MKIVIGLGNPGQKYSRTRHNVGFMFIDKCVRAYNVSFAKEYCDSIVNRCLVEEEEVLFVKPQLFMNASGGPVKRIIEKHGCGLEEILVVLDDINLPLGKIRIRERGSSGGHNGLKSISAHLKTTSFPRMRIGIGVGSSVETRDYVLSRFAKEENGVIQDALDRACKAINYWVTTGISSCMSMIN